MGRDFPGDERAQKLRELIAQEESEFTRKKTVVQDVAELQSLIDEGKYAEAFARGNELLRKHPHDDAKIFELTNFARNEVANSERSVTAPAPASPEPSSVPSARTKPYIEPQPAPRVEISTPFAEASSESPAPMVDSPVPQSAPPQPIEQAVPDRIRERPIAPPAPISFEQEYVAATDRTPSRRNKPVVPIAVGIAAVIAIVFVTAHFKSTGPTPQETTLQQQAHTDELSKDWPGALATYQSLAHLNGVMAADANEQAARLQGLLENEGDFFRQAQAAAAAGSFSSARDFYQQAANLHGDRQEEAVDGARRMNSELALSADADPTAQSASAAPAPTAKPVASTPSTANSSASPATKKSAATSASSAKKPAAAKPRKAAAAAPAKPGPIANCQLPSNDIPHYLDMADNNRARGQYSDAAREYSAVLQCEPANDRAQSGLSRTKQAEAIASTH